jgi:Xaa-Pro aminopeptidase
MMKRRQFLQTSAAAGSALALGAGAPAESATQEMLHPALAALKPIRAQEPSPISEAERAERRAKAQRVMAQLSIDAILVEPGPTLSYFTDVAWGRSERLFGMLLPKRGDAVFISPAFEQQRAESLIAGRYAIRVWEEDQSPSSLVAGVLKDWGFARGTLGVDPAARYFVGERLARVSPAIQVVTAEPVTNACRGLKTAHEVEFMRFANRVTIEAFRAAVQTLRAGMSQDELSRNIEIAFQRLGYAGGALVLFGESSAYPHGLEKPRALEEGQIALIDGGTSVQGYASDITRTVAFGTPSPEARKVFDIVKEAQARALATAKPGVACGEVDRVARDYITQQGYGPGYKYFTHRLGHGIGLEGHEWPYFVKGSTIKLEPGMSFSDEPGIYQYGKFGVRLEDIIVITEQGAEMLTKAATSLDPKEV